MRTLAATLLLLLCLAACSPPTPSPSATPLPSTPDGVPAGVLTRIDLTVETAADNRTVTIKFIGGPELLPTDPCYTAYVGWARVIAGDLGLAVVRVSDVHPPPGAVCAGVGVERMVTVILDAPYLGTTATDVSDGHTLDIERLPPG